jgi:hypothetical protein
MLSATTTNKTKTKKVIGKNIRLLAIDSSTSPQTKTQLKRGDIGVITDISKFEYKHSGINNRWKKKTDLLFLLNGIKAVIYH